MVNVGFSVFLRDTLTHGCAGRELNLQSFEVDRCTCAAQPGVVDVGNHLAGTYVHML